MAYAAKNTIETVTTETFYISDYTNNNDKYLLRFYEFYNININR